MDQEFLEILTKAKATYRNDGSWVRELAAIITRKHPNLRLQVDAIMRNTSTITASNEPRRLKEWVHPDAARAVQQDPENAQPDVEKKNTHGSGIVESPAPIAAVGSQDGKAGSQDSNAGKAPDDIDLATCDFDQFITVLKNRKGVVAYMESLGIQDTKGDTLALWERTQAHLVTNSVTP